MLQAKMCQDKIFRGISEFYVAVMIYSSLYGFGFNKTNYTIWSPNVWFYLYKNFRILKYILDWKDISLETWLGKTFSNF